MTPTPAAGPDTIVAVATPAGRGAVGLVRVSGPLVPCMVPTLLGAMPAARVATLRSFLDADGTVLDVGLATYFPAPASFTGEHVLELCGHGGVVVLDQIVRRVLALGARPARPGEFSERAFLNGKLDLAQAEAVADLIDAGTAAAASAAVRTLKGAFSARIHALQADLTALRVFVEAAIDFPEEEIDFLSDGSLQERLTGVFAHFATLADGARQGALLREGLMVVIAGRPNAGKSSILNRLAGEEVAIVTPMPGTTRDLLHRQIHIDGLAVNLVDTAGLRDAADVAEQEGIRRARAQMQCADRVLYVVDAAVVRSEGVQAPTDLPPGMPLTWVYNKIDLCDTPPGEDRLAGAPRIHLSAETGAGFDVLRKHLKDAAGYRDADAGAFSARRRHLDALERSRGMVIRAREALLTARAFELFAEDLRLAQRALGEITGEMSSDDLLGEIFGSFCVGK